LTDREFPYTIEEQGGCDLKYLGTQNKVQSLPLSLSYILKSRLSREKEKKRKSGKFL
jgi:hypothetical protein